MNTYIMAQFWLSNAWLPVAPITPPIIRDINGVALTVGDAIKIQGTITSLGVFNGVILVHFTNPTPNVLANPSLQVSCLNVAKGS